MSQYPKHLRAGSTNISSGGKLILIEEANNKLMRSSVSFGMLPAWWSRVRLTQEWVDHLHQAGFGSQPLVFHDTNEKHAQESTLFISTAVDSGENARTKVPQKCFVVYPSSERHSLGLSSFLKAELASYTDMEVKVVQTQHLRVHDIRDSVCVVLGLGGINLSTLQPDDYDDIKHMLLTCSGLIWVTDDFSAQPLSSMSVGLIRNLRWERHFEDVNFVTLSIADSRLSSREVAQTIHELFRFSFANPQGLESNGEYIFRDGMFWLNQLRPAQGVNEYLESKFNPQPVFEPLGLNLDNPVMLSAKLETGTGLVQFIDDPSQQRALLDDEVKIYVESWGLDSSNTTTTSGQYCEATGQVVEVGAMVRHLDLGDRVIAMGVETSGDFGTFLITSSKFAKKITPTGDITDAAGIPAGFLTAIYCLAKVARIQPNESILIHSAASAIGQAAIQIAQLSSANILAIVSTVDEKDILTKTYGLKEDQVFYDGDDGVQITIDRITAGRGLDVVLQTRTSTASHTSWRCLAPFGRFIDLIKDATSFRTNLDMLPFSRGAIYASVDIIQLVRQKPDVVSEVLAEVAELYDKQQICCPQPRTQFTFSELQRAISFAQQEKIVGSVILKPRVEDIVPVSSILMEYKHGHWIADVNVEMSPTTKTLPIPSKCFVCSCWWPRRAGKKHCSVDGFQRSEELCVSLSVWLTRRDHRTVPPDNA